MLTYQRVCKDIPYSVAYRGRSGPMDNELSGPLPILHNLIPSTPPPHTPLRTRLSLYDFKYGTFNQYISQGVFWKFRSLS